MMMLQLLLFTVFLRATADGAALDTEPPTCRFCPSDILRDVETVQEKICWKRPICSDNSNLPLTAVSNYPNGHVFAVPGSYQVQYVVTDVQGNKYDGCSFQITLGGRNCETLVPPLNGVFVGNCNRQYLSVCRFKCNEGYEGSGRERQCIVLPSNVMGWSGSPQQCFEIRCHIIQVTYAKIPSGTCRAPDGTLVHDLVYGTVCTFECNQGYKLVGNQHVTCQLDKTWSPAHPTCEEVRCPKLPSVPVGTFSPATCTTGTMRFDSTCALTCPSGYHIHTGPITLTTDTRRCYTNGSWEYRAVSPTCRDHEAPMLDCPNNPELFFDNDPGKHYATVNWFFDFTDNSLAAGEHGVTQDSFMVTLKIDDGTGYKDYNTSLPKLLEIGRKTVKYTVTDPSGNSASCAFIVVVRDTEPPTCSFCPLDIIIDDATSNQVKVNWDKPICLDNSGVPPAIETNFNNGDSFAVPGSYEVVFQVTDAEGNTDNNCSFNITLKKKACALYAPPKNGALTCIDTYGELSCAAMCNDQYDFAFTPPFLYFCSQGTWQFFSIGPYNAALPWPDCAIIAETANPSWLRRVGLIQYHFFVGDANTTDVQDTLRGSFLDLLQSGFIPSAFCRAAQCTKENVLVFPGET